MSGGHQKDFPVISPLVYDTRQASYDTQVVVKRRHYLGEV